MNSNTPKESEQNTVIAFRQTSEIAADCMKELTKKESCMKALLITCLLLAFMCPFVFAILYPCKTCDNLQTEQERIVKIDSCDISNSNIDSGKTDISSFITLYIILFTLSAIVIVGCFIALVNIIKEETSTRKTVVDVLANIYKEAKMNLLCADKKDVETAERDLNRLKSKTQEEHT